MRSDGSNGDSAVIVPFSAAVKVRGDKAIRVIVVDDHAIYRETLCAILKAVPNIEVVGEAENGQTGFDKTMELCPDVVLMDVNMPVLNGIDAAHKIKKVLPATCIIALSNYTDDYVEEAMTSAGAVAYLKKESNPTVIVQTILNAATSV